MSCTRNLDMMPAVALTLFRGEGKIEILPFTADEVEHSGIETPFVVDFEDGNPDRFAALFRLEFRSEAVSRRRFQFEFTGKKNEIFRVRIFNHQRVFPRAGRSGGELQRSEFQRRICRKTQFTFQREAVRSKFKRAVEDGVCRKRKRQHQEKCFVHDRSLFCCFEEITAQTERPSRHRISGRLLCTASSAFRLSLMRRSRSPGKKFRVTDGQKPVPCTPLESNRS